MTRELAPRLVSWTEKSADDAGRVWFQRELARASEGADIRPAFAAAGRRLGDAPLVIAEVEARFYRGSFRGWTASDSGRVALLLTACAGFRDDRCLSLVEDLYYRGELGEKCAVLRALDFLPNSASYVALAVEGCRTNARTLFEAIACGNAFPSRCFPELPFNQMVMKALFLSVPVANIVGLTERVTPALARMATDYESERRAAGRSVPDDIAWILGLRAEHADEDQ